ncbi:hypothetical protein OJE16_08840 [Pantoea tagorei]
MSLHALSSARLQQTFIHDSVRQRDATVGQQCEILAHSCLEYSTLGDFSCLGEYCSVADAQIGRFSQPGAPRRAKPSHGSRFTASLYLLS